MIDGFLTGVIVTCCLTASAFFLRFWLRTRDRLFAAFGIAFITEALTRVLFLTALAPSDAAMCVYGARLVAFCLILAAIADKNRLRSSSSRDTRRA